MLQINPFLNCTIYSGIIVHIGRNIHSRAIPIYEELVNVEKLITKQNMLFVGVPLSIKDGDGIPVRPVAFIY